MKHWTTVVTYRYTSNFCTATVDNKRGARKWSNTFREKNGRHFFQKWKQTSVVRTDKNVTERIFTYWVAQNRTFFNVPYTTQPFEINFNGFYDDVQRIQENAELQNVAYGFGPPAIRRLAYHSVFSAARRRQVVRPDEWRHHSWFSEQRTVIQVTRQTGSGWRWQASFAPVERNVPRRLPSQRWW